MKPELLRTISVFLGDTNKPLIVILGPTGCGKTALSIEIAQHFNGEIMNADSRQMFKHLDIGTAKITKEEMENVPHHLIDIREPNEDITVGQFLTIANEAINIIRSHNHIPIVVGGSMLYVSAITDGLTLGPRTNAELRERLTKEYEKDGGESMFKRLQEIDPEAAAKTHQNNKSRVIRAMEIMELTKQTKTDAITAKEELRPRYPSTAHQLRHPERNKAQRSEAERCGRCSTQNDILMIGIEINRDSLHTRIAQRADQMFENGWINEVQKLRSQGYTADDPGMKSTGYREIFMYLDEIEKMGEDADLDIMQDALKKKIISKTRQYARRQMSWWRGDERIHWTTN